MSEIETWPEYLARKARSLGFEYTSEQLRGDRNLRLRVIRVLRALTGREGI